MRVWIGVMQIAKKMRILEKWIKSKIGRTNSDLMVGEKSDEKDYASSFDKWWQLQLLSEEAWIMEVHDDFI
jgi:hypothetical protein